MQVWIAREWRWAWDLIYQNYHIMEGDYCRISIHYVSLRVNTCAGHFCWDAFKMNVTLRGYEYSTKSIVFLYSISRHRIRQCFYHCLFLCISKSNMNSLYNFSLRNDSKISNSIIRLMSKFAFKQNLKVILLFCFKNRFWCNAVMSVLFWYVHISRMF